jgi:hypothetical protein
MKHAHLICVGDILMESCMDRFVVVIFESISFDGGVYVEALDLSNGRREPMFFASYDVCHVV